MNIEVTGTISQILPIDKDIRGDSIQRILLTNVTTTNTALQVGATVIVLIKYANNISIPFKAGTPITVRGIYNIQGPTLIPVINGTANPTGFVRYSGRIYR